MITAFACQETGEIWPALRRQGLPTSRILELCVGDTIDASPTGGGRRAFPRNKSELLLAPQGDRMFAIARQGLVDMASYIPGYRGAASRPDKFCHGFGIFQLDLQFFKTQPEYFLDRHYADFELALARCVGELKEALKRVGWQAKTSLSDNEMAAVAIAYNTGGYNPARGLKQGYFDGTKYYGENYLDFLRLAKGVQVGAPAAPRDARLRRGEGCAARNARGEEEGGEADRGQEDRGEEGDARKPTAKKATAQEGDAEEGGCRRRLATKKAAPKKAAPKKAAPKKAATKKAVVKKAAAKKAAARR